MAAEKTSFPMKKGDYLKSAPTLRLAIADTPFVCPPREFSTGSVGFNANGKVVIQIGDEYVTHQVSVNITAVGSKEAN